MLFRSGDNYIWDSGVRINYIFKHKPRLLKTAKKYIEKAEDILHIEPVYVDKEITTNYDGKQETVEVKEFPAIYFPTNSLMVEHNQAYKINRMVRMLKRNQNAKILVSGYADDGGSFEQNLRRAKLRSQAVKRQLIDSNINEELIQIIEVQDGRVEQNGNCVIIDLMPQQ